MGSMKATTLSFAPCFLTRAQSSQGGEVGQLGGGPFPRGSGGEPLDWRCGGGGTQWRPITFGRGISGRRGSYSVQVLIPSLSCM